MKLIWSPENATKAYIDTVRSVSNSFLKSFLLLVDFMADEFNLLGFVCFSWFL